MVGDRDLSCIVKLAEDRLIAILQETSQYILLAYTMVGPIPIKFLIK